jgi:hypothetical protein
MMCLARLCCLWRTVSTPEAPGPPINTVSDHDQDVEARDSAYQDL